MAEPKRRVTEITIETHSLTIIRGKGNQVSAYCERCRKIVSAFTPEQIAALLRLDLTEVYCRVETDELHLTGSGRTVALICVGSSYAKIH
jgi:hypothetical protein